MNRRYLVAAALLIAGAAPLSAQSVKAGIDAWQRADYAAAVATWRPLAEKGDADAQFNLGQAYRLGRGVPTNLAAAKTWFERAASQGHIDAETTLGLLLFQNGNQAEGLGWLKKAADHGEPRALLVYGTALVNGDSVTQDPVLGYAYVSRAAAQGLQPAKDTLDQLDRILPVAARKRGAAMAREMTKSIPAKSTPTPVQVVGATPAPAKSRSKTVAAAAPPKPAPKTPPATALANAEPKAAPAVTAPAPRGGWRIQLGAFSQKGSAEALYSKVAEKAVLSGRRAYYIPVGNITRLQVGPFASKAAAEEACKSVGIACFPVPAK